jgi:hypothetical protein
MTVFNRAIGLLLFASLGACGRTPPIEGPQGIRASTIWVDRGPDVGQFSSLASDTRGTPHISYYDYTYGDLKYATLGAGGTWAVSVVDQDGDVGLYSSIALDSNDNPHIAYYDATNDMLKYAVFNGVEWRTATIYSDPGGLFVSLAIDANDVSHITFISRESYDLHYMKFDALNKGTAPEDQQLDTGTLTGPSGIGGNINGGTSIKIRPESQSPVVAYYHASFGALQVMRLEPDSPSAIRAGFGAGWVLDVVDGGMVIGAGKDDVGEYASLFVLGENDFHVSYYDKTFEDLRYAHWDGDRWAPEVVDNEGLVGESTSITVVCKNVPNQGRDCRPYISYFDSTNNDLKVATKRRDSNWVSFRADLSGMTGTYTSIAQVSRGRVGISYRDITYAGLKFLLFMPF